MAPSLKNVIRLDSLPLDQTFFTPEGYLIDRPIVTRTGIFEYQNPDGSIRRELRLPEDVFAPESLKSYRGKPVILTHDAGTVDSSNVQANHIGTILTDGYRSGENVRAEIIIHDSDTMLRSGLRELSLGYSLELEETPGEWNGERYDAIQRNIRINHLALVHEARAGEQARLNIDGRDSDNPTEGGKAMSTTQNPMAAEAHRPDGALSKEEFAKELESFKARRAQRMAAKADNEPPVEQPEVVEDVVVRDEDVVVDTPAETDEDKTLRIKGRRDRRDEEGDPEDIESAKVVIAQQDADISDLLDIIDAMKAEKDFREGRPDGTEEEHPEDAPREDEDDIDAPAVETPAEEIVEDGKECDSTENCDDGDVVETPEENKEDCGDQMKMDSVDAIINERISLGMLGRQLNMDGLEKMSIMDAKKAIIKSVRPDMRLDGKSEAYINAAFDYANADIQASSTKDTAYQKRQMFNRDSAKATNGESSADARQRMIDRRMKKEEK